MSHPGIRPTPPALSREQLARLPLEALLDRVRMLRCVDPLTVELARRLESSEARLAAARRAKRRRVAA